MSRVFIGIDVSESRGCAIAAVGEHGDSIGCRWSESGTSSVVHAVRSFACNSAEITIGIDSPRMPASLARQWYWSRKTSTWRPRLDGERGWGRHSEVIISVLGLANPQWTRPGDQAPAWMRLGFSLFPVLEDIGEVHEIFPTASYKQFAEAESPRLTMPFCGFARGPKDMLDAYVAALTVSEYRAGHGAAIGGGDGLGTIVLPKPVPNAPSTLLQWPLPNHHTNRS